MQIFKVTKVFTTKLSSTKNATIDKFLKAETFPQSNESNLDYSPNSNIIKSTISSKEQPGYLKQLAEKYNIAFPRNYLNKSSIKIKCPIINCEYYQKNLASIQNHIKNIHRISNKQIIKFMIKVKNPRYFLRKVPQKFIGELFNNKALITKHRKFTTIRHNYSDDIDDVKYKVMKYIKYGIEQLYQVKPTNDKEFQEVNCCIGILRQCFDLVDDDNKFNKRKMKLMKKESLYEFKDFAIIMKMIIKKKNNFLLLNLFEKEKKYLSQLLSNKI